MTKKDEAIHFCIGILEGLSSGNLKKSSKMIDLGIKGIRELVELSDSAKSGVGNIDHYIQMDDGTWIDLDPCMKLTPAFDIREGEKVKVIIIKEDKK